MRGLLVNRRARPCIVCGRRVDDGTARCPQHAVGSARLRPCLVCGVASRGNYCDMHQPIVDEAERLARQPWRRNYSDATYQRNRRIRFERAHGRCEACGIVLQANGWECDHVVELRDGGTNDVSNLRALCRPCHMAKTRAARKRRRDTPD